MLINLKGLVMIPNNSVKSGTKRGSEFGAVADFLLDGTKSATLILILLNVELSITR